MRCIIMLTTALTILLLCRAPMIQAVDIKDIVFRTTDAGRVVFSHKLHLKQPAMADNCKACHDGIYAIKKKIRHTMADMEKGKSCGACHDGKKSFPLAECARCHQVKEVVYQVKNTGPTRFSHTKHLAASQDCAVCHPGLFAAGRNRHASMADMEKGKSCGACHNGKKAFGIKECTACHPVRDQKYAIKGAGNVLFSHTVHTRRYACDVCHPKFYATSRSNQRISMKAMEKGKSCGACHDGKTAFSVQANCATCHKAG